MFLQDIAFQRLNNQQLSRPQFSTPDQVVACLGAIQAQDYYGAKWAVGQRLLAVTDHDIELAFDEGVILRTHVLRPTWHFVTPQDIGWMLKLTAAQVHAANLHYYHLAGLDESIFKRSHAIMETSLRDRNYLTRRELTGKLGQSGIITTNLGYLLILMHAELEGLICSGPRRGKQFSYALLEERVPGGKEFGRQEALAELAKRYFSSRGPATIRDFRWWSGLSAADAASGLEMIKYQLDCEEIDSAAYWFSTGMEFSDTHQSRLYILPNYDEYIVGYKDRSHAINDLRSHRLDPRGNILSSHTIVANGKVRGKWERDLRKGTVKITPTLVSAWIDGEEESFILAARRYSEFLDLALEIG